MPSARSAASVLRRTKTNRTVPFWLLRYYHAYRTMVRAKVTRIRLSQSDLPAAARPGVEVEFRLYATQTEGYTRPGRPRLLLMRGVSGAGKSVISESLLERLGAILWVPKIRTP